MTETMIDARGQACPIPLILTQKALKDPAVSDPFVVVLNSDSARESVERYLQDQKRGYIVKNTGEEIHIKISRSGPISC